MKRPTKQLLEDLLADSASLKFRALLMHKTLRSARRRQRVRHFNLALGVAALAGIFAYTFHEMRHPVSGVNQARQTHPPFSRATLAPPLNMAQVASTKPDSTLNLVQTSESAKPREINDNELLALLAGKSVALVRYAPNQTELISFDPNK